ncbi:MAG: hypothetical protein ACLFRD_04690 [Nitriliruptoraceae bacterium]
MPGLTLRREVDVPPSSTAATEPSVLVRLAAPDRGWVEHLPAVPGASVLTVSVGHAGLLPVPADELTARGYRIVGITPTVGAHVDVLVPLALGTAHPGWWQDLVTRAERVFDLRLGPVRLVLADEIELHQGADAG